MSCSKLPAFVSIQTNWNGEIKEDLKFSISNPIPIIDGLTLTFQTDIPLERWGQFSYILDLDTTSHFGLRRIPLDDLKNYTLGWDRNYFYSQFVNGYQVCLKGWNTSSSPYYNYPQFGWQAYWHWADSTVSEDGSTPDLTMRITKNKDIYTVTCTYSSNINVWIPAFGRSQKLYPLTFSPSWSSNSGGIRVVIPYIP